MPQNDPYKEAEKILVALLPALNFAWVFCAFAAIGAPFLSEKLSLHQIYAGHEGLFIKLESARHVCLKGLLYAPAAGIVLAAACVLVLALNYEDKKASRLAPQPLLMRTAHFLIFAVLAHFLMSVHLGNFTQFLSDAHIAAGKVR